jgi:DNA-binding NarL/FixJ family response regulator
MPTHILLVDADANASMVTCAFVRRLAPHATVACERTAQAAWSSFQRVRPDLLVIDPSPFGPQGLLLIHLLRQQHPDCRVVVLASRPTPVLRRKCAELRIDAYLEKPAPLPLLGDQLRAMLAAIPDNDRATRSAA